MCTVQTRGKAHADEWRGRKVELRTARWPRAPGLPRSDEPVRVLKLANDNFLKALSSEPARRSRHEREAPRQLRRCRHLRRHHRRRLRRVIRHADSTSPLGWLRLTRAAPRVAGSLRQWPLAYRIGSGQCGANDEFLLAATAQNIWNWRSSYPQLHSTNGACGLHSIATSPSQRSELCPSCGFSTQ